MSLVQRIAAERGVPVALVAGRIGAPTDGFVAAHSLLRLAGQGRIRCATPRPFFARRAADSRSRSAGRRTGIASSRQRLAAVSGRSAS
ncbi:hypothetical protein [Leucobacter soli]|uniref:hypothetical protein n=1 Tax=Leucobacter soli TaxID=2812850 RepID=UPI00361B1874